MGLLTPAELSRLWAGQSVGAEGVDRWKEVTKVSEEVSVQAEWFWEILHEADDDMRGKVLKFCTAAPRLGRAGLKHFEIQSAEGDDCSLPQAMTCGPLLQLPPYTSKEVMEERLSKASMLCEGFQKL